MKTLCFACPVIVALVAGLGVSGDAGAQTFSFSGTGAIADGGPVTGTFGEARVLNTNSNVAGNIQDVVVSMTVNHSWVGDLRVRLGYRPSGSAATTTITLINRIGCVGSVNLGDSTGLAGTYVFVFGGNDLWNAADGLGDAAVVPAGVFQPMVNYLNGTHENIELADYFRGLPGDGQWTLTLEDAAQSDVGSIEGASVTITSKPLPCLADFNGDGSVNTADLTFFLGRFGNACP